MDIHTIVHAAAEAMLHPNANKGHLPTEADVRATRTALVTWLAAASDPAAFPQELPPRLLNGGVSPAVVHAALRAVRAIVAADIDGAAESMTLPRALRAQQLERQQALKQSLQPQPQPQPQRPRARVAAPHHAMTDTAVSNLVASAVASAASMVEDVGKQLLATAYTAAVLHEGCRALPRGSVAAFVINLASRGDKWECFQKQAAMLPFLDVRRLDAVEGAALPPAEVRALLTLRARSTLRAHKHDSDVDSLGAVGCTLSHMAAWRAIVADGAPAFVFEDDAALLPHELVTFARAAASGDVRHDYVRLGSHGNRRPTLTATPATAGGVRELVPYPVGALSTGSHAYWCTPRAAEYLLQHALPMEMAVDSYMASALAEVVDVRGLLQRLQAPPAGSGSPQAHAHAHAQAQAHAHAHAHAQSSPSTDAAPRMSVGWCLATATVLSVSDIFHPPIDVDLDAATEAQPHDALIAKRGAVVAREYGALAVRKLVESTVAPHMGLLPAVLQALAARPGQE